MRLKFSTFKPHIMSLDLLLMLIKIMMLYYDHIWKLWWFHNDEIIMFLIRWELRHLHSPNYALLTDARATSEDVYPIGRLFGILILSDYPLDVMFIPLEGYFVWLSIDHHLHCWWWSSSSIIQIQVASLQPGVQHDWHWDLSHSEQVTITITLLIYQQCPMKE